MRTLSCIPLLAALSCVACASTPSDPPDSPDMASPGSECRAEPAQQYVGRKAETQVVDAAKAASQARQVRVIGPEDAVTTDFRPDRLNIRVDAGRTITEIACG
jgi:hypothetical protein